MFSNTEAGMYLFRPKAAGDSVKRILETHHEYYRCLSACLR